MRSHHLDSTPDQQTEYLQPAPLRPTDSHSVGVKDEITARARWQMDPLFEMKMVLFKIQPLQIHPLSRTMRGPSSPFSSLFIFISQETVLLLIIGYRYRNFFQSRALEPPPSGFPSGPDLAALCLV